MQTIDTFQCVGGVRLTAEGLHWGHFLGTIGSFSLQAVGQPLWYVIKDTEPLVWASATDQQQALVDMTVQALAASANIDLRPVALSHLLGVLAPISALLQDIVTVNALVGVHYKKAILRQETNSIRIKELMFPIDEAAYVLGPGFSRWFGNRENERLIRFCRDCSHKLERLSFPATRPQRVGFPGLEVIPGADGLRMARSSRNCLDLMAEPDAVSRFFQQMANSPAQTSSAISALGKALSQLGLSSDTSVDSADALAEVVSRIHTRWAERAATLCDPDTVARTLVSNAALLATHLEHRWSAFRSAQGR